MEDGGDDLARRNRDGFRALVVLFAMLFFVLSAWQSAGGRIHM